MSRAKKSRKARSRTKRDRRNETLVREIRKRLDYYETPEGKLDLAIAAWVHSMAKRLIDEA